MVEARCLIVSYLFNQIGRSLLQGWDVPVVCNGVLSRPLVLSLDTLVSHVKASKLI